MKTGVKRCAHNSAENLWVSWNSRKIECYHCGREWYYIYACTVKHYHILKAKTRPDKAWVPRYGVHNLVCYEKHFSVNRRFLQLFTNMTMKSLHVHPLILGYTNWITHMRLRQAQIRTLHVSNLYYQYVGQGDACHPVYNTYLVSTRE